MVKFCKISDAIFVIVQCQWRTQTIRFAVRALDIDVTESASWNK